MICLKIVKIKMIMGMLALSSLCLGQDFQSKEYNDLLSAIQQCNFKKFENLYYQNNLSENKKKELQKRVQNILESEKNKLPNNFSFWGNTPFIEKINILKWSIEEIDMFIEAFYKIKLWTIAIVAAELLYFLYPYIKLRNCSEALKKVQNCTTPIPFNTTAAHEAIKIDVKKRYWISHSKENFAAWSVAPLIASLVIWRLKKANGFFLIYKRYKNVIEIKKLIESSLNAVVPN